MPIDLLNFMNMILHVLTSIARPLSLYPIALRASPATVPGLIGSLVESLIGWVKRLSIEKLAPKINQVGVQNPESWGPKSIKIEAKIIFGGVLGPSWPQEAPRHQKMVRKGRALAPPEPKLGPRIDQHLSQE